MGRAIFISYRRDDTEGEAGRLFDDLVRTFGEDSVFMDVAGINPGIDFRKAIDANVSECGVLLAMIGPTWATIANSAGTHRLDDPNDFVRLEIASALAREVAVIPVLVHDAKMPHPDQLPDNLKDLAFRNSVEITHARWNSDVQLLIGALGQYVSTTSKKSDEPVHATVSVQLPPANPPAHAAAGPKPSKKPLFIGIGVGVLLVVVTFVVWAISSSGSGSGADKTSATQTTPSSAQPQQPSSDSASVSTDGPFDGIWTNSKEVKNKGLDQLEITSDGDRISIHAWGHCEPKPCDWGTQSATVENNQAEAKWTLPQDDSVDTGRVVTMTIKPEAGGLQVHVVNTYDNQPTVEKQWDFVKAQSQ